MSLKCNCNCLNHDQLNFPFSATFTTATATSSQFYTGLKKWRTKKKNSHMCIQITPFTRKQNWPNLPAVKNINSNLCHSTYQLLLFGKLLFELGYSSYSGMSSMVGLVLNVITTCVGADLYCTQCVCACACPRTHACAQEARGAR